MPCSTTSNPRTVKSEEWLHLFYPSSGHSNQLFLSYRNRVRTWNRNAWKLHKYIKNLSFKYRSLTPQFSRPPNSPKVEFMRLKLSITSCNEFSVIFYIKCRNLEIHTFPFSYIFAYTFLFVIHFWVISRWKFKIF